MSAHTPGPWEAQQQDRVLTGPHREEHASWFVTAEGPGEEEGTHICSVQADDTGKATAANARLIAAAPSMLAGLKIAVARLARVDGGDTMAVSTLLDVIHDATGEEFDIEAFIADEDAKAEGKP